jgi:MFS family permease
MEAGLLAPLVGILVDRWGPRRLLLGGVIISSLGLILLSRTNSLAMFYGAFLILGVGMSICSSTVLMAAVANWVNRKIDVATGIMVSGYGFGGLLVPVIVRLIEPYGWQEALTLLTVGMMTLCLPLSLLVRHKPEQYGYQANGEADGTLTSSSNSTRATIAEVNIGTRQAIKSLTFWHIALSLLCQAIVVRVIVAHIMPYLASIQTARREASLIASSVPLIIIIGRLGLGWLGDRLDKRWVIAIAFAMMCGGLLCFAFVSFETMWLLVLFLILFGIGYGGNNTLKASVIREFFGRGNFGAVHGLLLGMIALGTIAGPPLAGWVFDN